MALILAISPAIRGSMRASRVDGLAHAASTANATAAANGRESTRIIRSFYDFNGKLDFDGFRGEAQAVSAGLIAEFTGNRRRAGRCGVLDAETSGDFKIARVNGKRLFGKAVFFHAGLGVEGGRRAR